MRRVASICSSACMAWLLFAAVAQAVTVYRDALRGIQTASTESDGVNLLLDAEGDLPGGLHVSLRRDGNRVTGGSWSLTVFPQDAGPTANEKGRLSGGVSGGTLTFNGDGALTKAEAVRLIVQGGTGQHAGVKSGSGDINLSSDPENPSRLTGTLTLNL